jgi:hypothetical protein
VSTSIWSSLLAKKPAFRPPGEWFRSKSHAHLWDILLTVPALLMLINKGEIMVKHGPNLDLDSCATCAKCCATNASHSLFPCAAHLPLSCFLPQFMRSRQSAASKKIVDSRWLVLHNSLPRLTALSHPYTERVVSEAFLWDARAGSPFVVKSGERLGSVCPLLREI